MMLRLTTPFCRTAVQPHADRRFRDRTIEENTQTKPYSFYVTALHFAAAAQNPRISRRPASARDGTEFTITFFRHASLAISVGGNIYIDPVSANADYGALPKADVVLITHSHYDHLDVAAVEKLSPPTPKSSATGPRPKLSK